MIDYKEGHLPTKCYFYIQRGVSMVNDFKYLMAGVMAMYYFLKLDNIAWIGIMFILTMPVLMILGWLQVHKMAKVLDWLGIEYATTWARYSFSLQERQIELLEKLNKSYVKEGSDEQKEL